MTVLVTGCYGFLGHATSARLLQGGHKVIGIDKLTEAISAKAPRIEHLARYEQFEFHDINLARFDQVAGLVSGINFDSVVHYAGLYSVAHSTEHVKLYAENNVLAFLNLIECARLKGCSRFVLASSTFVQDGRLPRTMYGATKEFAERCANVYAELGMGVIALRFGSTYGPMCRPDIGIYGLARRLFGRQPIDVSAGGFNYKIAFLYIDDAVETVMRCLSVPVECAYNLQTVVAEDYLADLDDVLQLLERHSGLRAIRVGELSPRQGFQIPTEKCDRLRQMIGYAPQTKLDEGVARFVEWFKTIA